MGDEGCLANLLEECSACSLHLSLLNDCVGLKLDVGGVELVEDWVTHESRLFRNALALACMLKIEEKTYSWPLGVQGSLRPEHEVLHGSETLFDDFG